MRRLLQKYIDEGLLPRATHPCSYLCDREATVEGFRADAVPAEVYHDLMNQGFRRSGDAFYRPCCRKCTACLPLRVPVEDFEPSRSQKRAWRKNQDLKVSVCQPQIDDQRVELYRRYMAHQHPGSKQGDDAETLERFLYCSAVNSMEFCYRRPDGELVGVSLVDVSSRSLSSVYFYFHPCESRRSLGVYSVLSEIDHCRRNGVPYYYLGYWVDGSPTMAYKARYFPHEVLQDGSWVRREAPSEGDAGTGLTSD